jgi:peptidyl-prolyl cis-trans isomerase A (cyclophilin A)
MICLFRRTALASGLALGLLASAWSQTTPATAAVPAAAVKPIANAVIVTLDTSDGRIVLELNGDAAPNTVKNFVSYVKDGYYNQTIFHRVISGFMIQGGGFTGGLQHKDTRAPIAPESKNGLHNLRGSIAMARTSDPNSATAQFFINVADNAFLDYPSRDGTGYTVFGKVIDGMDVVDKIGAEHTHPQGYEFQNLPDQAVFIKQAHIGK